MTEVIYEIGEHDGGWAYKVGNVYSDPIAPAKAFMQPRPKSLWNSACPGETEAIQFEDAKGQWHTETAQGGDRPRPEIITDCGPANTP